MWSVAGNAKNINSIRTIAIHCQSNSIVSRECFLKASVACITLIVLRPPQLFHPSPDDEATGVHVLLCSGLAWSALLRSSSRDDGLPPGITSPSLLVPPEEKAFL